MSLGTFVRLAFLLSLLPGAVPAQAGFKKAIAGGDQFFLLLQEDGAVLGFGRCGKGSLASAGCRLQPTPVRIPLPAPAIDIAAGESTGYAVLNDGTLHSWGSSDGGMLGRPVPSSPGQGGSPTPGRVPGLTRVTQVVAVNASVAAVTSDGELWMWGVVYERNQSSRVETPRRIEGLPPIASFSMNNRNYASVIHMFALARDGSVWTWGNNAEGQLGNGTTETSSTPGKLPLPPVASVAAGGNNGVAVLADGTVRVWGDNDSSTMANGRNESSVNPTPTTVPGITGAASVSAGYGHIIVVLRNGTMRTWGHDGWGQAGVGTAGGYQLRPGAPRLSGVVAAYASRNRCFAIGEGGRLWFWGMGYYELPGPMKRNQKLPVELTALW